MTAVSTKFHPRRLSLAAFMARPESTGRIEELLGGALVVSPTARERHNRIGTELALQLAPQVSARGLGRVYASPLTIVLGDQDAPAPDLCVIVRERLHILKDGYPHGAPDLVVEVLSPSNRSNDTVRKKAIYALHGVREYWIVDGDAGTVTRYFLHRGRYGLGARRSRSIRLRILPQVTVDIAAIWRAVGG